VGDIFFQQKCFEHIGRLRDAGVTILYVSHDLASVKNVCDRVLVMKDGGIAFDGSPSEGVNLYFRGLGEALGGRSSANGSARATRSEGHVLSEREISERSVLRRTSSPVPPPALELRGARVYDEEGHDGLGVEMMGPLLFQLFLRAHRPVEVPIVGLHLHDRLGNLVFASGTLQLGEPLPPLVADQELVVSFRIEMRVSPGEYTFDILTGEPAAGDNPNLAVVHDSHESLGPIVVSRPPAMLLPFYGIAQLPITVSHQHRSAPPS
jgi:lipopolysaccharide transport system ATP-binding protein